MESLFDGMNSFSSSSSSSHSSSRTAIPAYAIGILVAGCVLIALGGVVIISRHRNGAMASMSNPKLEERLIPAEDPAAQA